jgi:hypothetical protein
MVWLPEKINERRLHVRSQNESYFTCKLIKLSRFESVVKKFVYISLLTVEVEFIMTSLIGRYNKRFL